VHNAKQKILRRMREDWQPGTRVPPISDLAPMLEVGHVTAHRAVRELAEEGLLISRRGLGTYVATTPVQARTESDGQPVLSSLSDKTIAVLVGPEFDPEDIFGEMYEAFRQPFSMTGARIVLKRVESQEDPKAIVPNADAIVWINPNTHPAIKAQPGQSLMVMTTAPETLVAMSGNFDVVSVEHMQGTHLAGELFRESGHDEVCFLGVSNQRRPVLRAPAAASYTETSLNRLCGFEGGFGRSIPSAHYLFADYYSTRWGARAAADYVRMSPRPRAVYCISDELAVGFIQGATAHHLIPGEDYVIVGFDGRKIGRQVEQGPLTTVRVPAEQMGQTAAELLARRLNNPGESVRRILLGCGIFEGATHELSTSAST